MSNFFNNSSNQSNVSIEDQYNNLKDNYQQIFIEAAESIRFAVEKFKPENLCKDCGIKDCKITVTDEFSNYPIGCKYRDWQSQILTFLNGEYRQRLKNIYQGILSKKNEYRCIRCGNCCRLATSQYSYEQLKQRAVRGDKFSKDFVSVFVPYKTEEEARQANPEYFKKLDILELDEKIYYYYCPKLVGNECSVYENRPDVCKDFPHNPLKLLPSTCSFNEWIKEVSRESMLLKAKTDIIDFYKEKLG